MGHDFLENRFISADIWSTSIFFLTLVVYIPLVSLPSTVLDELHAWIGTQDKTTELDDNTIYSIGIGGTTSFSR